MRKIRCRLSTKCGFVGTCTKHAKTFLKKTQIKPRVKPLFFNRKQNCAYFLQMKFKKTARILRRKRCGSIPP